MANDCSGSLQACALRVARLDVNGATPAAATNMYVTDQMIKLDVKNNVEAGTEETVKNACGSIKHNNKTSDQFKNLDLTLELSSPDPELSEMLAGLTVLTTSGATIGAAYPAVGAISNNGVSLEIWTKAWLGGGAPGSNAYWRWVIPKAVFTPSDRTFDTGFSANVFTGVGYENAGFGNGPNNDIVAGALATSGRALYYFRENTIPTTACGYAATPTQT